MTGCHTVGRADQGTSSSNDAAPQSPHLYPALNSLVMSQSPAVSALSGPFLKRARSCDVCVEIQSSKIKSACGVTTANARATPLMHMVTPRFQPSPTDDGPLWHCCMARRFGQSRPRVQGPAVSRLRPARRIKMPCAVIYLVTRQRRRCCQQG